MKIMDEIIALNDVQLIGKLRSSGLTVGPITPTTRRIYQKRLFKALHPEVTDSSNDDNAPNAGHTSPASQSVQPCSSQPRCEQSSPAIDVNSAKPIASSFFGVVLPAETDIISTDTGKYVFDNKQEVLKFMKLHPGSRFKVFPTREAAGEFVQQGVLKINFQSPNPNGQFKVAPGSPAVGEGSPFKGPKPQELVMFRKAIENNDVEKVRSVMWANPRYLVSSVDTPTILQEGFHYNAFHVTASKNKPEICRLILDTLESPRFFNRVYPDDTLDTRLIRMNFVVDLYLNTPDGNKGNSETPLHFACKFGNADVVEVLTSHPRTDRTRKNKYGETPLDVVCSRTHNPTHELKEKIFDLLECQYYVPLLRPEDNSSLAKVAIPWSPSVEKDRPLTQPQPETQTCQTPTESPYSVKAYAGPMSPSQADKFRRRWLTPPSPSLPDRQKYAEVKRSDNDKGYERIGRNLAKDMRVPWSEYWPFLDEFTDLTSADGLEKLELYLERQRKEKHTLHNLDTNLQFVEHQLRQLGLDNVLSTPSEGVVRLGSPGQNNDFLSGPSDYNGTKNGRHETENMETECPATAVSDSSGLDCVDQYCVMDIPVGTLDPGRIPPNSTTPMDLRTASPKLLLPGRFTVPGPLEHRQSAEQSDSSFSSVESYETAAEDFEMDDVDEPYSECTTPRTGHASSQVFILGEEPSKADLDVLRAVEDSPITPENFPHVHSWKNLVLSYSEQARTSWRSPARVRGAQSTPRRLEVDSPRRTCTEVDSRTQGQFSVDSLHDDPNFRNIRTNLMDSFQ